MSNASPATSFVTDTMAVVLWLEKRRLPSRVLLVQELPLSGRIARAAVAITDIPELHDRLIAASGAAAGCAVLTNDPIIQASRWVTTLW